MNEHQNDFLCISKRSMSALSAGLLLILFFVFMTGYVWGKRIALEDVLKIVEEKTFADQISGSLYSLAGSSEEDKKVTLLANPVTVQVIDDNTEASVDTLAHEDLINKHNDDKKNDVTNDVADEKNKHGYYAQLIGFNSKKAAEQFVNRINSTEFASFVKERFSKNIHGKKKFWYQVVTQRYENKKELERLIAHITKKERLSGVRIVAI